MNRGKTLIALLLTGALLSSCASDASEDAAVASVAEADSAAQVEPTAVATTPPIPVRGDGQGDGQGDGPDGDGQGDGQQGDGPDGPDGDGPDGDGPDGEGDQGERGNGGRGGRGPQGINDDVAARREAVRGARGQGQFQTNTMGDREVRSYDGTSNNEANPEWGASFAHLQRLTPVTYEDGIASIAGTDNTNPRIISNFVVTQDDGVDIPNPFGTSDFLWQWGQFLDHDLSLTDGAADDPAGIPIPAGDPFFDPTGTGEVELDFFRAIYDPESGTDVDHPREQENEITSWIDGSMIYGSDDERAEALREGADSPFLATSSGNLLPFNVDELVNASGTVADLTTLFLAGDVRVNEQPGLAVIHTLFVREHNRLAAIIQEENPGASADEVFEAARRLVIATVQRITYDEYLPALIGASTMPSYGGYDASTNPTIYNEFSVAVYRLGHSELSPQFQRLDASGNVIAEGNLALRDSFFTAHELLVEEDDLDPFIRGLATQLHQAIDRQMIEDLRSFLFGPPGSGGFDLAALNIQRGRDHGIGSYNDVREAMGLGRVTTFAEVNEDPATQEALSAAYASVDDIDLWIGGLAETPLMAQGSQLGATFTAVMVKQFDELRAGDRFWYEIYLNDNELQRVADVTLADVIRNNTSIGDELQDAVFYTP